MDPNRTLFSSLEQIAAHTDLARLKRRFDVGYDTPGPDECWLWQRSVGSHGYGTLFLCSIAARHPKPNVYTTSHRLAYLFAHKEISEGLYVLHSCDTRYPLDSIIYRRCCNPAHLWAGTADDNVRDRIRKGRSVYVRGEDCGRTVFTDDIVLEIRALYSAGASVYDLARLYGVGETTIGCMVHGKSWKHLPGATLEWEHGQRRKRHPNQKFTDDSVKEVFARHAAGESKRSIARYFEVDPSTIADILSRKIHKHVVI